jgi:hypothetical protein
VLEMRKKHGFMPKIHTCSGPDSHNEQTPALKVPLQTELRFHLCRYEQPPRWRACGATKRRQLARQVVSFVSFHEQGGIHSGCESPERGQSKPSATRASRSSAMTVEKGHGSRGKTMVTRSAITKQKRWRRRGLGARFPLSGYSLGLRKPEWEASSRVKNRHRSLSRIYKGPGETRSTLRPNPPRDSKLKARRPFLERLAHAQRLPHKLLVPSH